MFTAGVATLDITPPVGVRMAGFGARTMPSLAVHDALYARALVLDDGRTRAALVACDLIGVSEALVAEVRERVAAAGFAPEAVLVAGTHTHSGPARGGEDATAEEKAYWGELPSRLAAVISEAVAALGPAELSYTCGWAAIGVNRRMRLDCGHVTLGADPYGRIDNDLGLLCVTREGRPYAALMNHACHAVSLMSDNYLLSADYPGHAVQYAERALPGATGLYFNGACGNINPRECALMKAVAYVGSFVIAQRAGAAIAREAAAVWPEATAVAEPTIRYAQRTANLPTDLDRVRDRLARSTPEYEASPEGPAVTRYDLRDARVGSAWMRQRWEQFLKDGAPSVKAEVQAIAVGPIAFLGWPAEAFCELGIRAKRQSPFAQTFVLGYANGSIGYLPTPQAYREGGYEVDTASHLADDAGLVLVEESRKLLVDLYQAQGKGG